MLKNHDSNQLQYFVKTFVAFLENMNFTEMDRVAAIWDDELTSILDIEKIGHRKRILLSLAGRDGIPHRFGKVKVKFKEKSGVFRHILVILEMPKAIVLASIFPKGQRNFCPIC